MSGDMFDFEDCDDPGEFHLTPTEYSGVSAGSSVQDSPAIASQSSSNATPTPSQTVAATPSPVMTPSKVIYSCPQCRSKLKTLPGFKKHLANQHNMTAESVEAAVLSATSVQSVCQPVTSAQPSTSTAAPQRNAFPCPVCNKVLTTEGGYLKHRASHRYQAAAMRMPNPGDFTTDILVETMTKIVNEILEEPSYEDIVTEKKSFMEEFKDKTNSPEWMTFSKSVSDKVCAIVCGKHKKLMPLNQYEESQQKLHAILFQEDVRSDLCFLLKSVCHQNISKDLANRLVYRITIKLFWDIQSWATRKTREITHSATDLQQEMSSIEKESFVHDIGEIIRNYYKKCIKAGKSQALRRSACLSDKFIDGQHPIASHCLLDKEQWFTGDEDSLVPSENATNFFCQVQSAAFACVQDINEVTDRILDNYCALNFWHHLTSSHFPEEESLLFMKDIIKIFSQNFIQRKEKQLNRAAEKAIAASRVALRQDFNRNLKQKETVESPL